MKWRNLVFALVEVLGTMVGCNAAAQDMSMPMPEARQDARSADAKALAAFFMRQSSGTATQPASWPMPMLMASRGSWQLGLMGQAFLVATSQTGPRGDEAAFSVNWLMASASRPLATGRVQFRVMASLEPATVGKDGYPLLFQTGESAHGRPLVDRQHPHDLFMEISAQFAHRLGQGGIANVYYAPVGDAALGPAAFPHRASALELPQATLGHHWQDSTHIASNVLTVGWERGPVRAEASAFHGQEPDENRWNVDIGTMDSWSVRGVIAPGPDWLAQVSFGRLRRPERLEAGDVDRTTASIERVWPRASGEAVATSVIWGTNRKSAGATRTHALTFETLVPVAARSFVTARLEWSQRDELFADDPDVAARLAAATGRTAFGVTALTGGYTRDVAAFRAVHVGIGGTVTRCWADSALEPFYGRRLWGLTLFARLRAVGGGAGHMMHQH